MTTLTGNVFAAGNRDPAVPSSGRQVDEITNPPSIQDSAARRYRSYLATASGSSSLAGGKSPA